MKIRTLAAFLALPAFVVLLVACSPSVKTADPTGGLQLPPELQDCKFFRLSDGIAVLNVARCPNSTTSVVTTGKNSVTSITIDEAAVKRQEALKNALGKLSDEELSALGLDPAHSRKQGQ